MKLTRGQPASLGTVLHVMSNLPADSAAPVVGRQLAVRQHLRVEEVLLQPIRDVSDQTFQDTLGQFECVTSE